MLCMQISRWAHCQRQVAFFFKYMQIAVNFICESQNGLKIPAYIILMQMILPESELYAENVVVWK